MPIITKPATVITPAEHYENYLRYKAQQDALPQPFTASDQRTPLQYLPYAHYPATPKP